MSEPQGAEERAAWACASACARALFAIEGRVPANLREAIHHKRMRILAATVRHAHEEAAATGQSVVEVLEERRKGWEEVEAAVRKHLGIRLEPFNPSLSDAAVRGTRN